MGLPLAAVIADSGLEVYGIDINKEIVERVNSGENPIPEEKELGELLKRHGGKNLKATSDPKEGVENTDVHIVIVPLFIDESKKPDFSIIEKAVEDIGKNMKKGDLVILETTVPVGTTDGLVKKKLEETSGMKAGEDFYLAYSPERIMTGVSVSRFREFPKVVGGIDETSGKKALEFYKNFASKIELVLDAKTAEMIKLSEGIYRDVNIALANELFMVCQEYGVDFSEMKKYANHQYCHIHDAGIGVGGHCIPVYPWFIINDFQGGKDVSLIKEGRKINDGMVEFWAEKIAEIAKERNKSKVCVFGISYREGVKATYYTRSIPLINALERKGLDVFADDPLFSKEEIEKMGLKYAKKEDCPIVFNVFEKRIHFSKALE